MNAQAIHEAVRSGQVDLVQFLFEHGADIGHSTNGGGSALYWAKVYARESCIHYLEGIGAPEHGDRRHDL